MHETTIIFEQQGRSGTPLPAQGVASIPVVALGTSLGLFLALTFVLCVLFDLWFPSMAMNPAWSLLLPGFDWISWPDFVLGLIEAFAYGWYVALIFGPLFNFFASRPGYRIRS